MLKNNFFTFTCPNMADNILKCDITLNAGHPIFQAHFPGNPVLPGVCMMQMIKEVVETYTGKKLKFILGRDLKFLSVIIPKNNTLVRMETKIGTDGDRITVVAQLLENAAVFFKFNGVFVEKN